MTVSLPEGFVASGVAAGIKSDGSPDLALIATDGRPACAAAVFTQNLAAAAPVQVSRRHIRSSKGRAGAVVLNSGCANAATGERGLATAELTAQLVSECLRLQTEEVLVCSTGVIGVELPAERISAAIPRLCQERAASSEALIRAARAIMTTDTREKYASLSLSSGALVGAIAKGSGMLAPNMATMLAVVMTDAHVEPAELHKALSEAVDASFNQLSTDGSTSTNDTVIALASGSARKNRPGVGELTAALTEVCQVLAHQMAADAEGATKVVRVVVTGASDTESARIAARKVAGASLVKCSWYGQDPNWGRILSELGTADVPFEPDRTEISYGPHTVCRHGTPAVHDTEALARYLSAAEIEIRCDLGIGEGAGEVLSADLTHRYIDENMGMS
ncbi:MAG: bifunctional glutamate N-acetyltransferase/amino-acid acetyltransferase ArgJ [Acidimicrobiales bacterium]